MPALATISVFMLLACPGARYHVAVTMMDGAHPGRVMTAEDLESPAFLARLRAGDAAAFEDLVRVVGGRMYALTRRMLRSEADAADALQEAFVSAFKALPKFSGESKITTWLHRIVVNACLMRLRKLSRHPERSIDAMMPQFAENGHHAGKVSGWTENLAEREETAEMVRQSMADLPEAYREVLVLRDVEGLDTAQAAAFLGTSENNVKTRLHRARLALRELLDTRMKGGAA